jgi:Flp pilus assembly protein TadG
MHGFSQRTTLPRLIAALRAESGVALIEFALVLPLLALLLFSVLDMGKAFNYWIDETQLAHEGARYAAVNQNPDPASPNFLAALRNQAYVTPELRNGGNSVPTPLKVCVYLPQGPVVGKPVTVEVTSQYRFMSFITNSLGIPGVPKDILARSTMRLERVPTYADGDCA